MWLFIVVDEKVGGLILTRVQLTILVQQCTCMVSVYWILLVHDAHTHDVIYQQLGSWRVFISRLTHPRDSHTRTQISLQTQIFVSECTLFETCQRNVHFRPTSQQPFDSRHHLSDLYLVFTSIDARLDVASHSNECPVEAFIYSMYVSIISLQLTKIPLIPRFLISRKSIGQLSMYSSKSVFQPFVCVCCIHYHHKLGPDPRTFHRLCLIQWYLNHIDFSDVLLQLCEMFFKLGRLPRHGI